MCVHNLASKKSEMSVTYPGNKQVNIRIEPVLLSQIEAAADKDGVRPQDWIRNACRSVLGQDIPGTVTRSEFEEAIASLSREIKELKQLSQEKSQALERLEKTNLIELKL